MSLLRSKITEVTAECTKMRTEIERIGKDSSLMTQLERKYEGLIKEVRSLEGDLADYNLAMDKARTGTDAGEIVAYHAALKRRNEQSSRDVDAVFMEKQERERGVQRLQDQVRARGGGGPPRGVARVPGFRQSRLMPSPPNRSSSSSARPRPASTRCRRRSSPSTAPSWPRTGSSGRRSGACSVNSRRSTHRLVAGARGGRPMGGARCADTAPPLFSSCAGRSRRVGAAPRPRA